MVGVNGTTPRVSLSDGAGNGMGAGGTFVDTEVDGGFRLSELPPLAGDGAGGGADDGARRGADKGADGSAGEGRGVWYLNHVHAHGSGTINMNHRSGHVEAETFELSGEEVACELDLFVVMVTAGKLGSSRVSPKSKRSKI